MPKELDDILEDKQAATKEEAQPTPPVSAPATDDKTALAAHARRLWHTTPGGYWQFVKEHALEPADIWPKLSSFPVTHALHGYSEGAFGATLNYFESGQAVGKKS